MSDSESKPNKNSRANVVLFALMVSVVCSLMITAAATGLRQRQQENIALDRKVNLLRAAGMVPSGEKPLAEEIKNLFDTRIREKTVNNQGDLVGPGTDQGMRIYLITSAEVPDQVDGYILPINTRGLWGKIHGYLAFENDGQTVAGFSVYSHAETPGLGGEIESAWFQKNFKGKKIINSQGQFVSIRIAKGEVENLPKDKRPNHVDGISGATLTGQYLSEGIENTLEKYESVSVSFRQRGGKDVNPNKKSHKDTDGETH